MLLVIMDLFITHHRLIPHPAATALPILKSSTYHLTIALNVDGNLFVIISVHLVKSILKINPTFLGINVLMNLLVNLLAVLLA